MSKSQSRQALEHAKRLKASIKELEESPKDELFGIWANKAQDVAVYVREMRKGRGIK